MLHAEAPCLRIVGGAIGDELRLIRECVYVLSQLTKWNAHVHRHAVAHDVQIVGTEIHDAAPGGVLDVRIPDIPFLGNGPIEDPSAGRHLLDLQWDPLADPCRVWRIPSPVMLRQIGNRSSMNRYICDPAAPASRSICSSRIGQPIGRGARPSLPISIGLGMGKMNLPPASTYALCSLRISSLRFQASMRT